MPKFMGAIALFAGLMATAAQATPIVVGVPITVAPSPITAIGDVKAMYIFSDAQDASGTEALGAPFRFRAQRPSAQLTPSPRLVVRLLGAGETAAPLSAG
jgi:hypothetical protein